MHSSHHSRGRILFEVFCAIAVSASCVGAWMQTGASALLAAAAVTAVYGFWHLTDFSRPKPRVAACGIEEPVVADRPAAAFESEGPAAPVAPEPEPAGPVEESRIPESTPVVETVHVEPATPRTSTAKRTKAARKASGRKASAPAEAKVIDLAQAEDAAAEIDLPTVPQEAANAHIAPLFEPNPFVRMPRPAFGRKAGQ